MLELGLGSSGLDPADLTRLEREALTNVWATRERRHALRFASVIAAFGGGDADELVAPVPPWDEAETIDHPDPRGHHVLAAFLKAAAPQGFKPAAPAHPSHGQE